MRTDARSKSLNTARSMARFRVLVECSRLIGPSLGSLGLGSYGFRLKLRKFRGRAWGLRPILGWRPRFRGQRVRNIELLFESFALRPTNRCIKSRVATTLNYHNPLLENKCNVHEAYKKVG